MSVAESGEVEAVLARCLEGQWLAESVFGGDLAVLRFSNGTHLVCQRLRGDRDHDVRKALSRLGESVHDGVEPDEVEVGVNLGRNARRVVDRVTVSPSGGLQITFDGGWMVEATTDTDIVDWQWSVGLTALNPYVAATVAHFTLELEAGRLFSLYAPASSDAAVRPGASNEPFIIDDTNVEEAYAAVRDILYLYQDAVESYGGIGHNLDTGTFDAFRFARAVLAPRPGYTFGLDAVLLHQGAAVALLCDLSDHIDDTDTTPGGFGRTELIRFGVERGLLDATPLAAEAAKLAFAGRVDAFRETLGKVYQEYVLGHFQRLIGEQHGC
jgi:hypothetical protein